MALPQNFIMPANYLEAKKELLTFVKRPATSLEWASMVGAAINESIVKIQRIIPDLQALQTVNEFEYPASTKRVIYTEVSSGTAVNKLVSAEVVETGKWFGKPIKCYTYEQLTNCRMQWEQHQEDNAEYSSISHEQYVTGVHTYYLVTLGGGFCLYPEPAQNVKLSLHYTSWLPPLSADLDTNVLLKYAWDFVFYSALSKVNLFLNESERIEVSEALLSRALREIVTWNKSLDYSNPVEM